MSNVVVEVEDRMKGSFTMAVYSEAYTGDGISQRLGLEEL